MGLFLRWPSILVALFLAFFIGVIIGIGLIILIFRYFWEITCWLVYEPPVVILL